MLAGETMKLEDRRADLVYLNLNVWQITVPHETTLSNLIETPNTGVRQRLPTVNEGFSDVNPTITGIEDSLNNRKRVRFSMFHRRSSS